MTEWISVKDKLPEDGKIVVVALNDNPIYAKRAIDTDRYLLGQWIRWGNKNVGYWMPLPEHPKEGER